MTPRSERIGEDWLAVIVGLLVFALALGPVVGADLLGWAAAPKTWIELGKAVQPASSGYASLDGLLALLLTFGFVLLLMLVSAAALGADLRRFAASFTVVFWLAYLCWVAGNFAYIAVTTPADLEKFGIPWSLRLTGESGYLIAPIPVSLSPISCQAPPPGCARRRKKLVGWSLGLGALLLLVLVWLTWVLFP